jgi:hypothetical protein
MLLDGRGGAEERLECSLRQGWSRASVVWGPQMSIELGVLLRRVWK